MFSRDNSCMIKGNSSSSPFARCAKYQRVFPALRYPPRNSRGFLRGTRGYRARDRRRRIICICKWRLQPSNSDLIRLFFPPVSRKVNPKGRVATGEIRFALIGWNCSKSGLNSRLSPPSLPRRLRDPSFTTLAFRWITERPATRCVTSGISATSRSGRMARLVSMASITTWAWWVSEVRSVGPWWFTRDPTTSAAAELKRARRPGRRAPASPAVSSASCNGICKLQIRLACATTSRVLW